MLRRVPIALAIVLSAVPAWSQFTTEELKEAKKDPAKYTMKEGSLTIVRESPAPDTGAAADPTDPAGPSVGDMINLGKEFWKFIVDNQAVVNWKSLYGTALPKGAPSWQDMEGWGDPKAEVYTLTAKNLYNAEILNVRYAVLRNYGGSYEGKGKYLTAVTIQPQFIHVAWGFHFDMDVTIPESGLVNVGTKADPVAGMSATVGWHITSALTNMQGQGEYFLRGDGGFRETGGPFSRRSVEQTKLLLSSLETRARLFN